MSESRKGYDGESTEEGPWVAYETTFRGDETKIHAVFSTAYRAKRWLTKNQDDQASAGAEPKTVVLDESGCFAFETRSSLFIIELVKIDPDFNTENPPKSRFSRTLST